MVQLTEFTMAALFALICLLLLIFLNNDHNDPGAIPVLAW